jgi:divalent metal cation (Fe/Co/Zn/Cd) transporter
VNRKLKQFLIMMGVIAFFATLIGLIILLVHWGVLGPLICVIIGGTVIYQVFRGLWGLSGAVLTDIEAQHAEKQRLKDEADNHCTRK